MVYESKTAIFSSDRKYRYVLWRGWDRKKSYVMFIGLNPSYADEIKDDPTIRRCVGFARDWGYGGLCMTNLFAVRATNPQEMMLHPEPVGADTDYWLLKYSWKAEVVIAAWGIIGGYQQRDEVMYEMIEGMKCLGLTKAGYPRHPLYMPKDTKLRPFEGKTK